MTLISFSSGRQCISLISLMCFYVLSINGICTLIALNNNFYCLQCKLSVNDLSSKLKSFLVLHFV